MDAEPLVLAAFEASPTALVIVSAEGGIVAANAVARNRLDARVGADLDGRRARSWPLPGLDARCLAIEVSSPVEGETSGPVVEEPVLDPLTGLASRAVVLDRVAAVLDGGGPVGVLLFDLDDFKRVNDSLGHPVGDQLLVALAQRIQAAVRSDDLVARLGGDEFAIVAPGVRSWEDAARIGQRILDNLVEPFLLSDTVIHTGGSVGVTIGRDGRGATELLAEAEMAAYRAKELGKNRLELFSEPLRERATERLLLESELHRAIADREFDVDLQPIVELATGRIVAFEALARWDHPERGRLGPGAFIEVAEASGLIVPIGLQVIDRALDARASWDSSAAAVGVTINFAPRQLTEPGTEVRIADAVARTGLVPDLVTIEVTESALMSDDAAAVLERLKEAGYRIAIDDFGTGYSSLSYLRRLPLDVLKVDRSFVLEVAENETARAIMGAIVDLAGALGVDLVVEGIETEEQRRVLADLGCPLAQGFLFHRPMSTDAAREVAAATPSGAWPGGRLPAGGVGRRPGR